MYCMDSWIKNIWHCFCETGHIPALRVLFWLQASFDWRFLKYFQDDCTFHSLSHNEIWKISSTPFCLRGKIIKLELLTQITLITANSSEKKAIKREAGL